MRLSIFFKFVNLIPMGCYLKFKRMIWFQSNIMDSFRKKNLTDDELQQEAENVMRGGSSDENMEFEEPFEDSGSSFCPSGSSESSSSNSDSETGNDNPNTESDNVETNDEWTDSDKDPQIHTFTEQEGLKLNIPNNCSVWDIFSMIFDDMLIDKIRDWTNARADMIRSSVTLSRGSNMKKWKAVTSEELKRFLGLCIIMGNIQMPSIKCYWSKNIIYNHPLFGMAMPRNRFETILRCICFYSQTDDTSNRLHKIDQVMIHILTNIQNIYYPGENLSLDEALVLWRGRLSFKQYIPNKTAKYGIKLYELCTPDGFLLNVLIYTGKGTVNNENGHATSVVYKVAKDYLGKGHTIYMDNFYNSVHLAKALYKDKTHVVGTLRKNRKGNPVRVVASKIRRGETIFKRNGCVLVQKWRDKREVLSISTKHRASMGEITDRRGNKKLKPLTIIDYNNNMSGIDRCDQMVSYYSTPRKYVRWYMKIFFHLFDVTIWNACWLHNKVNKEKKTYLQFREEIALALMQIEPQGTASLAASKPDQHFPKKLEKRLRCRICSKQKKRTATFFTCSGCDDNGQAIGLCIDPCFKIYHMNK